MGLLHPNARIAKPCTTREEAAAEMQRLMDGINGFENCTLMVKSMKRTDEGTRHAGWECLYDDPADEYEYQKFSISDDGHIDWT